MINTKRLRCTIGWLGFLLPWIVVILLGYFPGSISATYFQEPTITPFMIILGSASLLLFTYKGYDKIDDWINTGAGIFGLMICLFPCGSTSDDIIGTFQIARNVSATLHNVAAIGFFALLSINSLFRFTKHSGEMTANKKKRNIIYIICGIGMIASFGLLLLPSFPSRIWLVEAIALFFFALSWLTKADYYPWLFADKT